MGRLLLNSRGFNTKIGCQQIYDKLKDVDLQNKKMFIVSYTPYGIDEYIVQNCVEILGFKKENLYLSVNGVTKNVIPDYIYVTEGNTFEVLQYMRDSDFTALNLFDGTIIPHYEPEHLENYIKNTEEHILNRYSRILSVSNEEVLVIENGEVLM